VAGDRETSFKSGQAMVWLLYKGMKMFTLLPCDTSVPSASRGPLGLMHTRQALPLRYILSPSVAF
jgi:hypothetical protein